MCVCGQGDGGREKPAERLGAVSPSAAGETGRAAYLAWDPQQGLLSQVHPMVLLPPVDKGFLPGQDTGVLLLLSHVPEEDSKA